MRVDIPSYRQFIYKPTAKLENLFDSLVTNGLGHAPMVIEFQEINDKRNLISILDKLNKFLKELNVNPMFPYPIYIISTLIDSHSAFEILKNSTELPKHFNISTSVFLRNKELGVLRKILLINQQLNQRDISELINKKEKSFNKHKDIFNINGQIDFLSSINNTLPDIGIIDD